MGNQQNPDGIPRAIGDTRRYLDQVPRTPDGKVDLENCTDEQIDALKQKVINKYQKDTGPPGQFIIFSDLEFTLMATELKIRCNKCELWHRGDQFECRLWKQNHRCGA